MNRYADVSALRQAIETRLKQTAEDAGTSRTNKAARSAIKLAARIFIVATDLTVSAAKLSYSLESSICFQGQHPDHRQSNGILTWQ